MIVALVGKVGGGFEIVGPFEDFDLEERLTTHIDRVEAPVRELLAYEVLSRETSLDSDIGEALGAAKLAKSAFEGLKPA